MKSNAAGVVGTRRCNHKNSIDEVCGGIMEIKEKTGSTQNLPCTAQCTKCKSWFDCSKPRAF